MAGKIRGLVNRDGRHYARLVVPVELRGTIGKTELRKPLGADRREALRKLPAALKLFNDAIDDARRKQGNGAFDRRHPIVEPPPTDKAILRRIYAHELHLDSRERDYRAVLDDGDFDPPPKGGRTEFFNMFDKRRFKILERVASGDADDDETQALVGWRLDELIATGARRFKPGSDEWRALARQIAGVEREIIARKHERNQGDFHGKPRHNALNGPEERVDAPSKPLSLLALLEAYGDEMARSGRGYAAVKRWRPALGSLIDFVGFDDASKLSRQHVIAWKTALAETLDPKTIRDVHLAALKTVLARAVENDVVKGNVAADVRQRVPKKPRLRSPGFTDREAVAILKAALSYEKPPRESDRMGSAKKWVPVILAHTGARIGEICQLRKEDFEWAGEIPSLTITPEAGSVKTGEARTIPVHRQLIELGLREFVLASPNGALFFDAGASKGGKDNPATTVAGRVTQWLQAIDVIPEGLQPAHGWRHRFKTVARELGLDTRIVDAIQGHAARTAGEAYGSVTLKAMARELQKVPAFDL